jgi:hypothetical protein
MGSYADRSAQSLGSDSTVRELLGLHGSLFTLRFGGRRNCVLTAQEGFLVQFGDGGYAAFEQTFSFTYLFLHSPVSAPSSSMNRGENGERY